jgi:diguanylate cyclase (GGDEF)-like protein
MKSARTSSGGGFATKRTATILNSKKPSEYIAARPARSLAMELDDGWQAYQTANEISDQSARHAKQLNGLFEIALNNMARGLSMFDEKQRLVVCNKLYGEIFNLPQELTKPGTPFADIIAYHVWTETGKNTIDDRARQQRWIDTHVGELSAGRSFSETRHLKNGRTILVTNQPLPEGGWVDIQEDITEKSRAENKIEWLARHDTLTELHNRFHFREELQKALRAEREFSIFWIDLDNFKAINDTLGHLVGDALLKSVAKRLRKAIRQSDVLARIGGDEFAVIRIGAATADQSEPIARRLLRAITIDHMVLGNRISVTASMGIALAPVHGNAADEILKNADLALYSAKASGRSTYAFFDPAGEYNIGKSQRLEADLKIALKKKQFELHYQPILDIKNRCVGSFEALIRWRHPDRGLVPPSEFIEIAEETGLIIDIGAWALMCACRDAVSWPHPIKVTVNLSAIQFEKGDLYAAIAAALKLSGLAPQRLELEVTESVLLRDHPNTRDVLHRLRDLGVKISLDDFGTAYASLSYLRSFPFDKLKIDRSFVRDFGTPQGGDCMAIVQSVAGLAKRLRMTTIAEGVETADQFDLISSAGCEEVQGFYFSKPVPVDEIDAVVRRCQSLLDLPLVKSA